MNGSTVVIVPPGGNMADYIASLRRLLDYDVKVVAPGHGELISDCRGEVEKLVRHRLLREAKVASEAPIIAGVFMNRLRVSMRLQTDPTLIYHPKRLGRAPGPSDRKDATNPYNTYAHDGLPPGPICSPTRTAIEATLSPSRHDFLYFCARHDGTGRHAFARTLEEHEANVTRYLKRR